MKKTKEPKLDSKTSDEIDRLAKGISLELEAYFKAWETGVTFKKIFGKFARAAKNLNMSVNEFAYLAETKGYVIIGTAPDSQRYVFPGTCTWSKDKIQDHLHEKVTEQQKWTEAKREARRENV